MFSGNLFRGCRFEIFTPGTRSGRGAKKRHGLGTLTFWTQIDGGLIQMFSLSKKGWFLGSKCSLNPEWTSVRVFLENIIVAALKINGWNKIMQVWFRSYSFLFMGDGCRFQSLTFQGFVLLHHNRQQKIQVLSKIDIDSKGFFCFKGQQIRFVSFVSIGEVYN